jgi:glucose-1-phosphate thymidylyltransferase
VETGNYAIPGRLSGYPWLHDKNTCFAMPDTVFHPPTAFQDIIEVLETYNADLVLGVFPTDEAQHFAPVEFEKDGSIISIEEKPEVPKANNAWGIAVWNAKFWEFFKKQSENFQAGVSITQTFSDAISGGLKVRCVYFESGWYKDIGRINNISF